MSLTDPEFWDSYWGDVELPALIDTSDAAARALADAVTTRLRHVRPVPADATGSNRPRIIELGCAPGRWLALFYQHGFEVTGVENSPHGAALTRRNLELLDIPAEVIEADAEHLLETEPRLQAAFDAVISLGLIEHFEDPRQVIGTHAGLARRGGVVVIGVPNLTGPIAAIQNRLDPEWMAHHHAPTLDPAELRRLGEAAGLDCIEVSYASGFQPGLFEWKGRSLLGFAVSRVGALILRLPWQHDHRWLSGTIMAVFRNAG